IKSEKNAGSAAGHAVLMDRVYRHQRYFYDLTRKYYLLGRDRLVRDLDARPGESVVEIGCGTARNLIRIAGAYPNVRLYGLDASMEMLRTASDSVRSANLSGRISLQHGLAEHLTPGFFGSTRIFDHAVFSYSLSMIPDWRAALLAAADCVRQDGFIHVVDFGDLKSLWAPASRGLRAWLRLFHVAPRDELLKALEHAAGARECSLHILPGRYAFVLKASPGAVRKLLAGA